MQILYDFLHSDEASFELNTDRSSMDIFRKLTGFRQLQFEYLVGVMQEPAEASANDGDQRKHYVYVVLLSATDCLPLHFWAQCCCACTCGHYLCPRCTSITCTNLPPHNHAPARL